MNTVNAIFNPRLYEMSGGKIIEFDPAADSRRRARERAAARMETERKAEFELRRQKEKLRKRKVIIAILIQKLFGIMLGLGSIMAFLTWLDNDFVITCSMITAAIACYIIGN